MNKKMKTEKQMMKLPVYAGILFSVLEIMMALYANSQAVLMDSIYDFAEAIVLGLIIFLIPLFYFWLNSISNSSTPTLSLIFPVLIASSVFAHNSSILHSVSIENSLA